jgi:hypothetical protein
VAELRAVRTTFGRRAAARKAALLREIAALPLTTPRLLRDYHDVLLFMAAYPDGPDVRETVEAELTRLAARAAELAARRASTLADTGIAGTTVESAFSVDTMEWLCHRFPGAVEVAWSDESAGAGLDALLWSFVTSTERDGLLRTDLTTREWVRRARGSAHPSDLAWIVQQLRRVDCPPPLLDEMVEKADLQVRWRLAEPSASITLGRFPPRPTHYQRNPPPRRVRPAAVVTRRIPPARPLAPRPAARLIDVARATLAARLRETDPVTYADPREVTLFRLERGLDVAVFGMQPARRLPVESFFGYVLARNRVPAAYGGGWVLFDRAEVGINVFEAVRGGESARLFAEVMRVYHQHFGVRRFRVDPFQFGADNADAIRSGAFWFYYRFGFRPTDPEIARRARDQWRRLRDDRSHRTPAATLRAFATSPLALALDGAGPDGPDLLRLGSAVTTMIGRRFDGDRARAERWSRRHVARLLPGAGPRDVTTWTPPERDAFNRLSVLVGMIPDLPDWSRTDRRALATWMRAKGGPRERDYVLRGRRHARLQAALSALAASPRP